VAVLAVTGRDIVYSAPLGRETSKQRDVVTHASRESGVISVLHGTGGWADVRTPARTDKRDELPGWMDV